tara:strand:- start:63 stop:809 length:747 start_codon:yes stop_codon:yes gene_type:complete
MCTERDKTSLIKFSIWKEIRWEPTKKQLHQFIQLQELLREWNKKINLTRLIDGNDYWISQVGDSLWPLHAELQNPQHSHKYIDVGSGCGFPGLAIAIAMPNSNITLLDSSTKKTTFLKGVAKEIGLTPRITVITDRAEATGKNPLFRGKFDYAIARAVAPAPVVAEYLVPFLSSRGQALIFKGSWTNTEQQILRKALTQLNAHIKQQHQFELPDNRGSRNVIRITSIGKCPSQYPRSIGKPRKQPLGC